VDLIVDLTGCRATPQFGARPYRDAEMWHLSGKPGRAQATLGWQAHTSLHDGLKATIAWMQTHRSMYG
jgi:nucleoside-diphosphate-sugar epimerase